ncbi:MAG: helix-turn-helix transcriptional regulator [Lachnospiraceae bacterium]|nr:helix-turn-helix transcriptional regulator [Lachnospiraceae bacterium]
MTTQNERKLKENIQKNLIFYRKMRKITQKQLADSINTAVTTLSGWERGVATPDIDTLFTICNFLQVSLNDMCGVLSEEDSFSVTAREKKLLVNFQKLNEAGKEKLQERMEELFLLGYTDELSPHDSIS